VSTPLSLALRRRPPTAGMRSLTPVGHSGNVCAAARDDVASRQGLRRVGAPVVATDPPNIDGGAAVERLHTGDR
jgi:hypothetical protein